MERIIALYLVKLVKRESSREISERSISRVASKSPLAEREALNRQVSSGSVTVKESKGVVKSTSRVCMTSHFRIW